MFSLRSVHKARPMNLTHTPKCIDLISRLVVRALTCGTGTVVTTVLLASPLEDVGPEKLRSLPFCALYSELAEGLLFISL